MKQPPKKLTKEREEELIRQLTRDIFSGESEWKTAILSTAKQAQSYEEWHKGFEENIVATGILDVEWANKQGHGVDPEECLRIIFDESRRLVAAGKA